MVELKKASFGSHAGLEEKENILLRMLEYLELGRLREYAHALKGKIKAFRRAVYRIPVILD